MDFEIVASLVLACLAAAPRGSVVHVSPDGSMRTEDPDRPRVRDAGAGELAFARVGSLPSVETIAARLQQGTTRRPRPFHPHQRSRRLSHS
jgi:hypothetical protein